MTPGYPHGRSSAFPYVILAFLIALPPSQSRFGLKDSLPWDNITACSVGRKPESSGTLRPPFAPQFDAGDAFRIDMLVGLVVGCTLLVFAIIGVAVWFFWLRYRRQLLLSSRLKPLSKQNLTVELENGGYSVVAAWTPGPDKKFYHPLSFSRI
jgi:amino acid transporter